MKKQKKAIIIFAAMFGVALVLFDLIPFKTEILIFPFQLFDKNTISVRGENIGIKKVTIEVSGYSNNGIIFENGKKVKRIKNEYGSYYFNIFYDNLLIAQAEVPKTSWRYTHKHFIFITKNDSTFDLNFRVKGTNGEWARHAMYIIDTLNKTSTKVFYDNKGKKDEYIYIEYFDDKGNVIVDESWQNDTLIFMTLYKNGEWYKNYEARHSPNKLTKEPHNDSLKYIYQTIENGEVVETEIIKVKKQQ